MCVIFSSSSSPSSSLQTLKNDTATSVVSSLTTTTVNMNEALVHHSDECGGSGVLKATMTEPNEKLSPRQSLTTSDKNPCNGESVLCNSDSNSSSLKYLQNVGEEVVELDHSVLDLSTDSNAPPPVISKEGGGSSSGRSYVGQRSGVTRKESKREIEIENEYSASAIEQYTRSDEVGDFNDFNGDGIRDLRGCFVKGVQEGVIELDLDRLLQESEGYEFCCPNCHGCVKRIIIRKREDIHRAPPDVFRCVSCFSFLVFAGRRLVSLFTPEKRESTTIVKGETSRLDFKGLGQEEEEGVHVSLKKSTIVDSSKKDTVEKTISSKEYIEESVKVTAESFVQGKNSEFQPTGRISLKSAALITAAAAAISEGPKQLKKKEDTIIRVEETTGHVEAAVADEAKIIQTGRQQSTKGLEVLKSIVYGGLMESIASIGIVTSSVGSSISTLNMLAMALSNLLGGVVILLHNIQELRRGGNEHVDMYYESLGRRENVLLHVAASIVSFLIFGVVPPLTYVLSFPKNGTTGFKLASAIAASLLCVILLSIGKTYVQSPRGWVRYVKTVLQYACSTAVVFCVCYVAGKLIMKAMDGMGLLHQDDPLTLPFLHSMELSKILR